MIERAIWQAMWAASQNESGPWLTARKVQSYTSYKDLNPTRLLTYRLRDSKWVYLKLLNVWQFVTQQ